MFFAPTTWLILFPNQEYACDGIHRNVHERNFNTLFYSKWLRVLTTCVLNNAFNIQITCSYSVKMISTPLCVRALIFPDALFICSNKPSSSVNFLTYSSRNTTLTRKLDLSCRWTEPATNCRVPAFFLNENKKPERKSTLKTYGQNCRDN